MNKQTSPQRFLPHVTPLAILFKNQEIPPRGWIAVTRFLSRRRFVGVVDCLCYHTYCRGLNGPSECFLDYFWFRCQMYVFPVLLLFWVSSCFVSDWSTFLTFWFVFLRCVSVVTLFFGTLVILNNRAFLQRITFLTSNPLWWLMFLVCWFELLYLIKLLVFDTSFSCMFGWF